MDYIKGEKLKYVDIRKTERLSDFEANPIIVGGERSDVGKLRLTRFGFRNGEYGNIILVDDTYEKYIAKGRIRVWYVKDWQDNPFNNGAIGRISSPEENMIVAITKYGSDKKLF